MNDQNLLAYFTKELDEHQQVLNNTRTLQDGFVAWVTLCRKALVEGKKILWFGNGGSAADAQHLATELTVRYRVNRPAIASLALTTDTSALTAIGNDFGFDHLFARQIEALGQEGDIAIGITTSGKSPNIIQGLKKAKAQGLHTVGLTGNQGGDLPSLVDLLLIVPSSTTSRIQEMHIMLGQMLCGVLEEDAAFNRQIQS